MLEKERGNNIRWIKPEGQFVVKTKYDKNQVKAPLIQSPQRQKTIDQTNSFSSIDIKPGLKVFINICQSSEIKDATLQKSNVVKNNSRGQSWSIPYSLTYGRNDKDKGNKNNSFYVNETIIKYIIKNFVYFFDIHLIIYFIIIFSLLLFIIIIYTL